ncbi:hypothetical protein SAMN04488094_10334 [Tropicimonas isoalkanivorans]|uniref:Uncharacterized protein n=1 Tax=Tropicimonas isoalkanivorans TaxID=441112 RepID=A0A1I1H636_9RHOB|nr:hypothetical protein SAMN04488094_10334 [Tropicimonas isoalkanivorans]
MVRISPIHRPAQAPKPLPPLKLKPATGRTPASRWLRTATVKPKRIEA